jgi:hypothetical protein
MQSRYVTTGLMFLLHNKRDDRLRQHPPPLTTASKWKLAIAKPIYRRSNGAGGGVVEARPLCLA